MWVDHASRQAGASADHRRHIIGDFEPSPDGKRIVYTRRPNNQRNQQNLAEVFVLDVARASSTQLTKNEAPENNLAWAPDGKAVTYVAPHDKTWELAQGNLYIHPIEGGGSPTILSVQVPGRYRPLLLASVVAVHRHERQPARPRRRVRARPHDRARQAVGDGRCRPLDFVGDEGPVATGGHAQPAIGAGEIAVVDRSRVRPRR